MSLSYWLRAEVDDLLSEETFFDSSEYSSLLEDTEWKLFVMQSTDNAYIVRCQLCKANYSVSFWRRKGFIFM